MQEISENDVSSCDTVCKNKKPRIHFSDETKLLFLAFLVGIIGGYGAIIFRSMIFGTQHVAMVNLRNLLGFMGPYAIVIIPAIGGLIVGLITTYFASEAKGHGVPEVMGAVLMNDGRIRPSVSIAKILASALCIGTGGSAGREGPIVQIGAAFASTVAQWLKLPPSMIKNLVAAGAAAGISATFNAPLGGVIFGLEVILGEYRALNFGTLVMSSVTAAIIARVHLGNIHDFQLPSFHLVSPVEMIFYATLGLLAAGIAVAFIKLLYDTEDIFDRFTVIPRWVKPAIGGLGVGCIAIFVPHVMGVGYDVMAEAIMGQYNLYFLFTLVGVKLLSTCLTLGSGGSGGIFSPSLFMGAMLGAGLGTLVHAWFPSLTASPGAYAIVGMGAVFAAGSRAPFTSVLILFELTDTYEIILPLMIAVVIATYVAAWLKTDTLYTEKLSRRGTNVFALKEQNRLDEIRVSDIMGSTGEIVSHRLQFSQVLKMIGTSTHNCFIAVDDNENLKGMVSFKDLRDAIFHRDADDYLIVDDIATNHVATLTPCETINDAMRKFRMHDMDFLPVVDKDNARKVLGSIARKDVFALYEDMELNARGKCIL